MTQLTSGAPWLPSLDDIELEETPSRPTTAATAAAPRAYIRVTLEHGELLFCAHHGAKYKEKLAATALRWHDESARLLDVAAD